MQGSDLTGLVGTDVAPSRGTLSGGVNGNGKLTLVFKGKSVGSLKSGLYASRSPTEARRRASSLEKTRHKAIP